MQNEIDKRATSLYTQIEHMGDPELQLAVDSTASVTAIAISSQHMLFNSLLWVSGKKKFSSWLSLASLVKPDDSPPFTAQGKTGLQVASLAWSKDNAFLFILFEKGALSVIPRLGSQMMKIYNPTTELI
jgi:hypothetical protein